MSQRINDCNNNYPQIEKFTSNVSCNRSLRPGCKSCKKAPSVCTNQDRDCPYHELKNRINLLTLLHQETEFDALLNIEWSILGPFQIYESVSPIKISIVEYQISKMDQNENFPAFKLSSVQSNVKFCIKQENESFLVELIVKIG